MFTLLTVVVVVAVKKVLEMDSFSATKDEGEGGDEEDESEMGENIQGTVEPERGDVFAVDEGKHCLLVVVVSVNELVNDFEFDLSEVEIGGEQDEGEDDRDLDELKHFELFKDDPDEEEQVDEDENLVLSLSLCELGRQICLPNSGDKMLAMENFKLLIGLVVENTAETMFGNETKESI